MESAAAVDVVIIGGGIVGTVLAKALAEKVSPANSCGLSVTLIDAADPEQTSKSLVDFNPFTDTRVIALARRTVDELSSMGLNLDGVAKQHNGELPPQIKHIEVSDKGHLGLLNLESSDYHIDAFGQVVSLSALTRLAATATSSYQYIAPAKVTKVKQQREFVSVQLDSGQSLTTKLLVLADGGRSGLAEQVGITKSVSDYHQTAIVFNVHTQLPHENKAYERFTQSGPLAFLPFDSEIDDIKANGNGFSVVWTVDTDAAKSLMALSQSEFIKALQEAFGYRQGKVLRVSELASYPLALTKAQQVASHRTVVVGNAAQALHPIAGQGFNLGLRDLSALVSILKNSAEKHAQQSAVSNSKRILASEGHTSSSNVASNSAQGQSNTVQSEAFASANFDAGAFSITQHYANSRKNDRDNTIALTDTLVRTFSNQYFPTVIGRNVSLLALSMMPQAKKAFVKHTTGYGETPQRNRDNNAAC
ncbi:2-octaprenyl-6-methoxyphenyl hydroxylase [Alteromonas portus]|uniref:2-octaprenyl-6-methoxyphenyl hydroxylase n=1 Tax=Alteromonas portus TaxID=2565549 RepID=A0A4U0ZBZ6_9ALTE|nr:FAD-dependent monooxygenase [Alteromonas portus]TKB03349.1 2-octaprenyl-6-methoxyphenyl hydroxylase [Alteromonas portus]